MLTIIEELNTKIGLITSMQLDSASEGRSVKQALGDMNTILEGATTSHTELFTFIHLYEAKRSQIDLEVDALQEGGMEEGSTLGTTISEIEEKLRVFGSSNFRTLEELKHFLERFDQTRASLNSNKAFFTTEAEGIQDKIDDKKEDIERYKIDEQADLWGPIELLEAERESRINYEKRLLEEKTALEEELSEKESRILGASQWKMRADNIRVLIESLEYMLDNLRVGEGFTRNYFQFFKQTTRDRQDNSTNLQLKSILSMIDKNIDTFRKAVVLQQEAEA